MIVITIQYFCNDFVVVQNFNGTMCMFLLLPAENDIKQFASFLILIFYMHVCVCALYTYIVCSAPVTNSSPLFQKCHPIPVNEPKYPSNLMHRCSGGLRWIYANLSLQTFLTSSQSSEVITLLR